MKKDLKELRKEYLRRLAELRVIVRKARKSGDTAAELMFTGKLQEVKAVVKKLDWILI